jgi:two-component system cell cycle response regulator
VEEFKVCVVDDCVDEATVLCEGLKLHGYDAVMVHTGRDALDLLKQGGVHLVLLDVSLPDMEGYDVCRALKADPNTTDIPVIFVTAKGAPEDVARGYGLGAVDYIAKPYNLPFVMVRVDSAMRSRELTDVVGINPDLYQDTCYTDSLTGLRNRRYLLERLQEETEKAHRYGHPVSCVLVDVDEVRALEQEAGSADVDEVLVEVAMAMRHSSRNYDILARVDSGLFAAVLPHARLDEAVSYAKKIENEVESLLFACPSAPSQAKLRFGVVSCRNGSSRCADDLIAEAMRKLLIAKSHHERSIEGEDLSARDSH